MVGIKARQYEVATVNRPIIIREKVKCSYEDKIALHERFRRLEAKERGVTS